MKTNGNLSTLLRGILRENPVLVLILGTCPTLATTTNVVGAFGMGIAALAVLVCSNVLISLLRKIIPDDVRIPCYIVIIAGFVTIVQMIVQAYFPALYDMLGVYLALITVNCIILGRAEMFAGKNSVGKSALDGIGMGLGFTLALVLMSTIREVLGNASFAGTPIPFLEPYKIEFLVKAPGGMVVYGLLIALIGTLCAIIFAYYMDRKQVKGHKIFDSLASYPYLIPGTCWGIGYILAFNHEPLRLTGTAFIVIANMIFKQLPTTTKICSAALTQIPHSLERAARDMGGGQGAVLKDVILPNMKPAFFSCFSYHFSSSMTSAGAILFLINPAKKLAVFQLFDAVSGGDYANASLIATLIILIVMVAEGIVHVVTEKEMK